MKNLKKKLFSLVVLGLLGIFLLFVFVHLGSASAGKATMFRPAKLGEVGRTSVIIFVDGRNATTELHSQRAQNLANKAQTPVIMIDPGNFAYLPLEEIKSYCFRLFGTGTWPVIAAIQKVINQGLVAKKKVYLLGFSGGNFMAQPALQSLSLSPEQNAKLVYLAVASPVPFYKNNELKTNHNFTVSETVDSADGLIMCSQMPLAKNDLDSYLSQQNNSPSQVSDKTSWVPKVHKSLPDLLVKYILGKELDYCSQAYQKLWPRAADGQAQDPHDWEGNYEKRALALYFAALQ